MNRLNKIIYFDRETISNILEETNEGNKKSQTEAKSHFKTIGEIKVESDIKLEMPFTKRLAFVFTGKISTEYIKTFNKETTITSTEISEFDSLKSNLIKFTGIQIQDIENSSTFFRIAGAYSRMLTNGVEGLDVNEFNDVMNNFDGYDTYKLDDNKFIRFNTTSFVSNYKRNDLLTTILTVYCIPVGKFLPDEFDFIQRIEKMQKLFKETNKSKTLADLTKSVSEETSPEEGEGAVQDETVKIELFDVVYAAVSGESNE